VYIYRYCPHCRAEIREGPSWFVGVGPLFVECSRCGMVVRIRGAYEWDLMPWTVKGIYCAGHGLGLAVCGLGVCALVGRFVLNVMPSDLMSNSTPLWAICIVAMAVTLIAGLMML